MTPKPGELVDCLGDTHIVLDADNLICHRATFDCAESENEPEAEWTAPTYKVPTCSVCRTIVRISARYKDPLSRFMDKFETSVGRMDCSRPNYKGLE